MLPSITMRVCELLTLAEEELAGIAESEETAFQLTAHVLGVWKRSELSSLYENSVAPRQVEDLRALLTRRLSGEPTQYITGETEFYGLRLFTTPSALIPRPETEILVEEVVREIPIHTVSTILDVGTGSGCIAIALGVKRPNASIRAIDSESAAIELATRNASRHGLSQIEFAMVTLESELQSSIRYDYIVANPPYISLDEYHSLDRELLDHEPRAALTDEADGYYFYRLLAEAASQLLHKNGWLFVEVGYGQAATVARLFQKSGLGEIRIVPDLSGIQRVVGAKRVMEV